MRRTGGPSAERLSWSAGRPGGDCAADLAEVVGQHSPADPALHASLAVVAAACQPKATFQHADAAFDPRPPAVGASKLGAVSHLLVFGAEGSLARQGDRADTQVIGESLVGAAKERSEERRV